MFRTNLILSVFVLCSFSPVAMAWDDDQETTSIQHLKEDILRSQDNNKPIRARFDYSNHSDDLDNTRKRSHIYDPRENMRRNLTPTRRSENVNINILDEQD